MKKTIYLIIVASFAFLLSACGAPTIDASSEEAMQESMEEVTKDMTEAEKTEFGMAFMQVSMKVAMGNMSDPEKAEEALKEALDGKTAEDIIEMGKE